MGTQALVITSVTPENGTVIKDSTDSVKVTLTADTAGGADNGDYTTCYYSSTGIGQYSQFQNTDSYHHSTDLRVPAGSYTYYIRCDSGGNLAEQAIAFTVQTDTQAPVVVRASHENTNLNIQTDEEAKCYYDVIDCNYNLSTGIAMTTSDGLTHSTTWVSGRTYYIKCADSFNNAPAVNQCSIILSPSQF